MFIVRLCVFAFVARIVCIGMIVALFFIFVDVMSIDCVYMCVLSTHAPLRCQTQNT